MSEEHTKDPKRLSWEPVRRVPARDKTLSEFQKGAESYTYPGRPRFCPGAFLLKDGPDGRFWSRTSCNGEVEGRTGLCFSCASDERENREELRQARAASAAGVKDDPFRRL